MALRLLRLFATLCAGLVAFVFVTGLGTAGVAAAGCVHPCGAGSAAVTQPSHSAPDPCVRDVGCGGGAALATGIAVAAVLGLATDVAARTQGLWRRARFLARPLVGRLLTGGLFRPPRLLIDA